MTADTHLPEVVSPEEWLAARKDLLVKEKEATRARDRVDADRRWLPMVRIDEPIDRVTARIWSPVSRFTGHARSRHASQTLRRGLLDQGGVCGHALLLRAVLRRREESLRCGPIMLPDQHRDPHRSLIEKSFQSLRKGFGRAIPSR